VEGREKHLYSIYKKMQNKKISLNEMVDVYGFRIIVDSADTCYRTLGLVHSVYKPMPGRFKDYIAIPRVNGYSRCTRHCSDPTASPSRCRSAPSKCIALRSPESPRIGSTNPAAIPSAASNTTARANGWRAWCRSKKAAAPRNSWRASKSICSRTRSTCSPQGKILRLPSGATAVDFAYAIHTDVGNRCVAAKVDRRLVPLRTPLRNGQTVEIITAKGATPNPSWSSFLVTAKARAAIRTYLKNLKRGEALELGRRLLGLALEEFSLNLKKIPAADIDAVVKELNLKDAAELYEKNRLGRAPGAPGGAASATGA